MARTEALLITKMHIQNRFSFMTLESFLTFFIFSFHTPKGFPSLHCICRIHHVSLLLVPSPPIQTSIMSCMDNCSSLLNYPLLPSLASYILFSSNLLKCCFSNWNIEDISLLFTTPPPSSSGSLNKTNSLTNDLTPLLLWPYVLPTSPQFTLP